MLNSGEKIAILQTFRLEFYKQLNASEEIAVFQTFRTLTKNQV